MLQKLISKVYKDIIDDQVFDFKENIVNLQGQNTYLQAMLDSANATIKLTNKQLDRYRDHVAMPMKPDSVLLEVILKHVNTAWFSKQPLNPVALYGAILKAYVVDEAQEST